MSKRFEPAAWPTRLNLGCGFDHRDGYLNVDLNAFHEPDLVADVTDLQMLPAERYSEIVAQDVLEHLPRTTTVAALSEWNRLLAPGGRLCLRVPSLLDLARLFEATENQNPNRQEMLMQCVFGTQAYDGDTHLTSFTRPLLRYYLEQEGFVPVRWELRDDWLFEIDAEKVSDSAYRRRFAPFANLLANKDPDAFLTAAYLRLLGRDPDPSGLHHYRTQLAGGGLSYRDVIVALVESDEHAARESRRGD